MENKKPLSNEEKTTDEELDNLFSNRDFYESEKVRLNLVNRDPLESISPNDLNLFIYYDEKYLRESQNNYELNNFVCFLETYFDKELVKETINKYQVGTSTCWKGASVFWQIDMQGRICGGNIMNYTGHHEESIGVDEKLYFESIQSHLYKKGVFDYGFSQKPVFFGEHLLQDNKKPIAIVESEKIAIVASILYPNFIWIATSHNIDIKYVRKEVLIDRDITLCPNNDNLQSWYKIAFLYELKISSIVIDRYIL